jgi:hypothetical protein
VKASFKKINSCSQSQGIVCEMYHANKGWIEVIDIE